MTIQRDKIFHALGGAALFGVAAFFLADALAFALFRRGLPRLFDLF